jgi:hypothetical protein
MPPEIWQYRVYRDGIDTVGQDPEKALSLVAEEGQFNLFPQVNTFWGWRLGPGDCKLQVVDSHMEKARPDLPWRFHWTCVGLPGSPQENWRYEYVGCAGNRHPDEKAPYRSMVGIVRRINAHGPEFPAGEINTVVIWLPPDNDIF